MKRIFIYILTFFYATTGIAIAQNNHTDYSFNPLSIEEGLMQSTIRAIHMDSNGTLWLGTKKGVNAFRQNKVSSYSEIKEGSLSLSDNYVNCISEDSLHNIWVGTIFGLSMFDDRYDKFTLKYNKEVFSSQSTGKCIYFGSNNKLLKLKNGQLDFEFITICDSVPEDDRNYRVVNIMPLPEGKLMLATRERGIFIYHPDNDKIDHFIDQNLHLIQDLCLASDSSIYVSTQGSGLFQYSLKGELIQHFSSHNSKIGTDFVLGLHEYEGNLWICTDGKGIRLLNMESREMSALEHTPGNPFTIPTNAITTLFETPNHQLWAGSVRRGVFYIQKSTIRTYREAPLGNPYGLTEAAVISLYEEENGLLWIGTDGGGINLFNPQTNRFKHYPSTYGDKIVSIAQLNKDELLLSVYTKGMVIFNKHTGRYKRFVIVDEETNYKECFYGYLPMAHIVAPDKVYIIGEHAWIYTPSTRQFGQIKFTEKASTIRECLTLAYSNPEFSLLMCNNEVFSVNQNTDHASLLFKLDENVKIVSLAYDKRHTIWVASNMGLGYYDMNTKKYKTVHTKLFDSTTFIIYDGKDRLWVSAQNSLFSYSIKENRFSQNNRADGFIPNEILFAYQDPIQKDFIYLGGNNGLVQIDNRLQQEQIKAPTIQIDGISLDGKPITLSEDNKKLTVPHNYNSLILSMLIINNDIFQRNLIKYSMEKDGVPIEIESYSTRLTMPASLSPGTYHIKAACFAKTGELPQLSHLLDIVVLPPWYQSNWFALLSFLLIVCIVLGFAYISYRIKAKKIRHNIYLYKQHINEEKINFLINVNHELRTPLTLIYAPLKRIIEKGKDSCKDEYTYEQIKLTYKQAKRMYSIINMVLDLNRVESGYKEMKMGLHNLNEWIKNTANDFLNEANGKNITLNYNLDSRLTQLWFDEWKCQIILSNLLMNAIKFSPTDSHINICTQLQNNGFVRVSVSDQGIGLSDKDLKHVFERHYEGAHTQNGSGIGLTYSKMLAEYHGGQMGCYNNEDKGATFYYELPYESQDMKEQLDTALPTDDSNLTDNKASINLEEFSILVVEDTDDLRQFLHDSFKDVFKEVYTAPNGQEALDLCYDKQPDLVVSDIMMPVMNGFELCRRIKSDPNISHIQVIMLTARNQEEDEKLGYKLGADFYLKKPFDMEFLQTILANILSNRQLLVNEKFSNSIPSPQEVTTSSGDEQFLCKLNQIINDNISNEELNINFITNAIGMGRTTLYKKMGKVTGMGVNDYINRIRIEKSVDFLLHSELSIKEISQELGFTYPRYFSTTFKQFKGVTPTQFKEQYRGKE